MIGLEVDQKVTNRVDAGRNRTERHLVRPTRQKGIHLMAFILRQLIRPAQAEHQRL